GLWALVAVVVIVSSNLFGAETEDSFDAPGVDSAIAMDLLSESGSDRAGLTARVVAATDLGFESPDARSELTVVRERLAALPEVISVDETLAPGGRVALLTVQYPVLDELTAADLDRLKEEVVAVGATEDLQLEAGGELFFTYEEPGTGRAELIGIGAAMVILLLAF